VPSAELLLRNAFAETGHQCVSLTVRQRAAAQPQTFKTLLVLPPGFYVLLDNHIREDQTLLRDPAAWARQWAALVRCADIPPVTSFPVKQCEWPPHGAWCAVQHCGSCA
jgi:hypothetical protein